MNHPHKPFFAVSCALIENNGKVLIALRKGHHSNGHTWEFPGGKMEPGETPEQCLQREIREELSIDIAIKDKLPDVEYEYPEKNVRLMPFICHYKGDKILCNTHARVQWVDPEEFENFTWSQADIGVWQQYRKLLNGGDGTP